MKECGSFTKTGSRSDLATPALNDSRGQVRVGIFVMQYGWRLYFYVYLTNTQVSQWHKYPKCCTDINSFNHQNIPILHMRKLRHKALVSGGSGILFEASSLAWECSVGASTMRWLWGDSVPEKIPVLRNRIVKGVERRWIQAGVEGTRLPPCCES